MDTDATREDGTIDCSVLVPVLDEERFIADSVRAMQAQRFPGTIEFLLADGGSTDRTRAILTEIACRDPRVRILENPRRTTPSGLNVALANARGRWVARMDAHTEYADDYLAHGVDRLRRGGTRWVSGPPVAAGNGPVSRAVALALRTPLGRGASRKWAAESNGGGEEYELDSGVFAGVWERRTLLEYGGWDEGWSRNQDSEMAGRFLAQGEKLICMPEMAAHYAPRNSFAGLWRQYLEYGEYREKTAVRHPQTMRLSHLLAPSLVIACVTATGAPAPLRTVARAGIGVYAAAVAASSLGVARHAKNARDAAYVPAVLIVMHLAHGVGTLRGAIRNGPPLAGIASALRLEWLAERLRPAPERVFAPSLRPPQEVGAVA